jgi:hypothetical protein
VIGAAEGTRAANGDFNPAYYGHEDPGDKLWNIGSFSVNCDRVKCDAKTPDEADQVYLERLRGKSKQIERQMRNNGTEFTLIEWVLLLDQCNQSPEACLGWSDGQNIGSVNWFAWLKKVGFSGDPLLEARVESYRNKSTQQFEAFRKTKEGMTADQDRRLKAASDAAHNWLQKYGYSVERKWDGSEYKSSTSQQSKIGYSVLKMEALKDRVPQVGDVIAGKPVVSGFGQRVKPCPSCSEMHYGIDVGESPVGSPVHTFGLPGEIVSVECHPNDGMGKKWAAQTAASMPNVSIETLHLDSCNPGQYKAGEVLGTIGVAGTGPHYHVQVRLLDQQSNDSKGKIPPPEWAVRGVISGKISTDLFQGG